MGKSFLGIFTGKFDNMSQIKEAIKKGGLIGSISDVLDWGIKKAKENKLIKSSTASLIKKGKNSILNNISDNIENNLTSQVESIEKIDKYTQNWSKYYEKKDFTNMERQFNKIQKELEPTKVNLLRVFLFLKFILLIKIQPLESKVIF